MTDSFGTSVAAIRDEFQPTVWNVLRVAATERGAAFDDAAEALAVAALRLDALAQPQASRTDPGPLLNEAA